MSDQESILWAQRGPLRVRSRDAACSAVAATAASFYLNLPKGRKSGKGKTRRGKVGAGSCCTYNAVWATLEPGTTSIGKLTWTTGGGTSSHRPPESVPEKMSPMSRCRCLPSAVAQGQGQAGPQGHYGGCKGDKRAGCQPGIRGVNALVLDAPWNIKIASRGEAVAEDVPARTVPAQ